MKYRCIKDVGGIGCLEVGKMYDVEAEDKWGHTIYTVCLNEGKNILYLSEETISQYFEKAG